MGLGTFLVGCLPTADQIGISAGILLVILRIIQGLALGGEYGACVVYIGETCPSRRRGFYTSMIQMCPQLALLVSMVVILGIKMPMGPEAFSSYGWRIPFLLSAILIVLSLYIRASLPESKVFLKTKEKAHEVRKNPLIESFCNSYNLRYVALALFGATMGMAATSMLSNFYALTFLQTYAHVPANETYFIIGASLVFSVPFNVVVGYLSDFYGRKPFMLAGLFLTSSCSYPIYIGLVHFGYALADGSSNKSYSPVALSFLVFTLSCFLVLAYSPVAAFLVELFPTSIRYTSMSLPYHLGFGVAGGLVPVVGVTLTKSTGNIYAGLWYPIAASSISFVIMFLFVPETFQRDIMNIEGQQKKNPAAC